MDTRLQFKDKHEAQKKQKTKKTTKGSGGLHAKIEQYACVKHQSMTLYKSLKLFS